jgi:hypothetical protein
MPAKTLIVIAAVWAWPLFAPVPAAAQDAAQPPPADRPTGLPGKITWTFNLDAGWGTFGFGNSLFNNPKEDVPEDLSDQWFEGSVKPAISASYRFANSSEMYGKVSVVGERTYGAAPGFIGPDISSFGPEDLSIGWRSGKSVGSGENAIDFTVGRAQYRLGHGFLLWDGAAEGGNRGGYWTNARKAFELAAIARFKPGPHTVEAFYLDKDDLPENDTGTRLFGANYEFSPADHTTLGATYMSFLANPDIKPGRDGLDVFNVRAFAAVPRATDLSLEFEYASERNGDALSADAWTLQGAYELSKVAWTPKLSYRYAWFEGDDPATAANENFDPLLLGFYDWGTWWQGEIAGEYAVSNSNLASHQIRAHVTPSDAVGGGLMFFKFTIPEPSTFAPGVTASDFAFEVDAYLDWKINANFTASFVAAFANPEAAAEQAFDRTKNFRYGMVFLAYSY